MKNHPTSLELSIDICRATFHDVLHHQPHLATILVLNSNDGEPQAASPLDEHGIDQLGAIARIARVKVGLGADGVGVELAGPGSRSRR